MEWGPNYDEGKDTLITLYCVLNPEMGARGEGHLYLASTAGPSEPIKWDLKMVVNPH